MTNRFSTGFKEGSGPLDSSKTLYNHSLGHLNDKSNHLPIELLMKTVPRPSSATYSEVFAAVNMPDHVEGLKILDLGGGASDATDRLVKMGADAFSIDPTYHSMGELLQFMKTSNRILGREFGDKNLESMRNGAVERFKQSLKRNPERYIAAQAEHIPFPENFFDIIFSRLLVLTYLDTHRKSLIKAVDESLRVLKPGGAIHLYPFLEAEPAYEEQINRVKIENNLFLQEKLRKDPQVESLTILPVKDFVPGNHEYKTLIIKKLQKQ